MNKKRWIILGALLAVAIVLSSCGASNAPSNATQHNQQVEASQEQIYNTNQPIPVFPVSQLRQTLIDIETAQAEGAPSTTFMMPDMWSKGVVPWYSCPSVGFPVASTDELSNPQQIVTNNSSQSASIATLPQIDPNGIYSGNSTGTYTICLNTAGQTYGAYWEGYTLTLTGNAAWDPTTGSVTDVTNPTGTFNTLTPAQQKAVNQAAISDFQQLSTHPTVTPTSVKP